MKRKGFTLIELLAVIVILAILALIVSPIISGVIKNAKISSATRSMEGFVESINTASMLYSTDNEGAIASSYIDIATLVEAKNKSQIKNPKVTLNDNGIVVSIYSQIDNYYCMYNEKDGAKCSEEKIGLYPGKVVYFNPVSGQICNNYTQDNSASGEKGDKCMLFYVVNDNGNTVDLILDHNTSNGVEWVSKEDYGLLAEAKGLNKQEAMARYEASTAIDSNGSTYIAGLNDLGPKTALDQLKKDTEGWHTSLTRTDSYTLTQGSKTYTVDYTGSKARMITAQEIADITGATTSNNGWNETTATYDKWYYLDSLGQNQTVGAGKTKPTSDYAWLFNNLGGSSYNCKTYGCTMDKFKSLGDYAYWTSSAVAGHSGSRAWSVSYSGRVGTGSAAGTSGGLRPVITIPSDVLNK